MVRKRMITRIAGKAGLLLLVLLFVCSPLTAFAGEGGIAASPAVQGGDGGSAASDDGSAGQGDDEASVVLSEAKDLTKEARGGDGSEDSGDASAKRDSGAETESGIASLPAASSGDSGSAELPDIVPETFAVNIASVPNGKVTASVESAAQGDTVTLTAIPD